MRETIESIPANRRTALQQLYLDAVTEAGDGDLPRTLGEMVIGHLQAEGAR